ncbi:MAG TPA: decarboxylating 6-phosphogluconate dehydrogenase [Dehalococcoidia bacterium]|jgi:6-phosphogluconate dehydrogenase|nr:6-phosphogluconate dehydrogenase (decarboxylating) [Chloroflexota bacterium]MDP6057015.1 decarboxylating 6-phosphogluconate dehydrogenase [Dehalococcoidia bacterium]MDP7261107.1 decarboxylating 6-phosphogluconate dehydrogenase [Dehalococcoidia bacterium]MDP7486214.1 decarboxylating 6-phosphogluconate dehydrogenase [Dehalococcoidia bacterium]HJP28804.1 decarboxylating 6-phosphogluconate dehydrogenase [Dehalococcoidia bacterium]|tara:strand:+ start:8162 stop:9073 length:912 start_codon:yes stop_codon:yes gene_type:complete
MKLGMVGLGRMGGNMTERLLNDGHDVVVFDPDSSAVRALAEKGASAANSLADIVGQLDALRTVWVMVPSGDITEQAVNDLVELLDEGDTLIDGGNSNYKESQRRGAHAATNGIDFLDSGTSGGVWGLANGYCLTVGGAREAYDRNRPIFETLTPEDSDGNLYVGPSGSGHYVKMIHNGIEYGLMQAYAEGFELLAAKEDFNLDLAAIAKNWTRGSVIRSWLLDLTVDELEKDPRLDALNSYVDDSGEGRWTVDASVELAVPAPVITAALQMRFRSRQGDPLGGKMLAAMRNGFGGHAVKKATE